MSPRADRRSLVPAAAARRLLLCAQGLLADPARRATLGAVRGLIEQLGFVQLDSINVLCRAHDQILRSRLRGYRPAQLLELLQTRRALFEGWTHDASAIPLVHYGHWQHRFRLDAARLRRQPWWRVLLGENSDQVIDLVRQRITEEGPLRSADFEHPGRRGEWWGWKPQKAALDYLWRSGELAVTGRVNFHKVYDLSARVFPELHGAPGPDAAAHADWACQSAAERLWCFTPRELARFWASIELAAARAWCTAASKDGRVAPVLIESADGSPPQEGFALAGWERRLQDLPEAPAGMRLLAPFDPVLRDRDRALRRFGFDYRFEAFVPPEKRQYGYYVLPLLWGERLVGRLDAKLHREQAAVEVRGLWWEPGVRASKRRAAALEEALAQLAEALGAESVRWPAPGRDQAQKSM